jgi:hypothetical protein
MNKNVHSPQKTSKEVLKRVFDDEFILGGG